MTVPLALDLVQTVAFAGALLFLGYGLKRLIPALARVNIPAPVCGGLPVAGILAVLYFWNIRPLQFDTALQVPLQNTFFASIGFAASLTLLRRGGPLVFLFFIVALVVAALQNILAVAGATVTLEWVAPLGGTTTSYVLEAGSASGLANLARVDTGSTATSISIPNVPSGSYFVRIRAANAQGVSVVSNEVVVLVP